MEQSGDLRFTGGKLVKFYTQSQESDKKDMPVTCCYLPNQHAQNCHFKKTFNTLVDFLSSD